MLLHLLVIAPFVAAILMVLNSREDSQASSRMAILMAAAFTAMSVALIVSGNQATTPIEWFHIPGTRGSVYYYLYAHGLGTWMVFLSCGLSLVALISARCTTGKSYRNFAIGIFALMGAMNGTFLAADAVLFFFFFEAMVIPAAVLIAGYGGEKRMAAAMTFAIYTLVGSAPMMVSLWYLLTLADNSLLLSMAAAIQNLPAEDQTLVLLSFLLAFLVKTPVFPFHGWQAITYSEAPAPMSAILTGAMSKAGVFGFIAWVLPIFPLNLDYITALMWLGLLTAIYGALMAMRATDGKRLLAYSSMSHLGLAVAGVFSLSEAMLPAVLLLLVAHGISAGAQYFLIGVAERVTGTRNIEEMGGLAAKTPVFGFLFGAAGVMALAVPGSAGFVGEFAVLLSLWDLSPLPALAAGFCLILSATYMLRFIQKVIFGKPARENQEGTRITALEGVAIGAMLTLLLAFGLHPAFVTNSLHLFDEAATEEVSSTEVIDETEEAGADHPMTAEELQQLDSTLAASGFTEEERKALIAQIQSVEQSIDSAVAEAERADSTASALEASQDSAVVESEEPAVETEKTEASEND